MDQQVGVDAGDVRRELILYATPSGPLGDQCNAYFAEAKRLGGTTAQTYPPHCTLTGFFRRTSTRAEGVITEMTELLTKAGSPPAAEVEVVGLRTTGDWVGIELRSLWLRRLTTRLIAAHRVGSGDDELRAKDWLHLSLAYGVEDLEPYAVAARRLMDPPTSAEWQLAIWERRADRSWVRHG